MITLFPHFDDIGDYQNLSHILYAMASVQDYDHVKYRQILSRFLKTGQVQLRQMKSYRIFNQTLHDVLVDYIEFGCHDSPKDKEFAVTCFQDLVNKTALESQKIELTISDAHKMTYQLLTSKVVGMSFDDIRVEHMLSSGYFCDLYLPNHNLAI